MKLISNFDLGQVEKKKDFFYSFPFFWGASTLKPRYSEEVSQTLFVHYIEQFTISNVNCLVNTQNGSWVFFTISRNSLFRDSFYQSLIVD